MLIHLANCLSADTKFVVGESTTVANFKGTVTSTVVDHRNYSIVFTFGVDEVLEVRFIKSTSMVCVLRGTYARDGLTYTHHRALGRTLVPDATFTIVDSIDRIINTLIK